MSVYITSEKISYFIYMLNRKNKNANTIAAYSNNIKKLVLFLDGSELSKEQMYAYREWLKKSGLKNGQLMLIFLQQIIFVKLWAVLKLK